MAREFGKLAQRYAKAIFKSIVQEQGREGRPTPAQQSAAALREFARAWREQPELSGTMLNPMFDRSERSRALLRLAETAGLPDIVQRGISVIFEHDRIAILPEIADALGVLADEQAGVVPVEITVARAVGDEEARRIEERVRRRIAGECRFSWATDAELLGGMVIKYHGKVVDGSLSSRLEQIERKLRG